MVKSRCQRMDDLEFIDMIDICCWTPTIITFFLGLSPLPECQSPPGLWTIFGREFKPKPSFATGILGGGTTQFFSNKINNYFLTIKWDTLTETNIAPENGFLEYDRFLLGFGLFSGAKWLLVSGSVVGFHHFVISIIPGGLFFALPFNSGKWRFIGILNMYILT